MKHLMMNLILLTSLLACGKAADKEDDKKENNNSGSQVIGANELILDTESSSALIQASLDQSLAAVNEEPEAESTASSLALAREANGTLTRYRHCEVDGDTAVVNIQRKLTRTVNVERPRFVVDFSAALETSMKRTWSRANDSIECHSSQLFAKLPVLDMEGMHLKGEVKRSVTANYEIQNKRNGNSWTRAFAYNGEGELNVDWLSVTTVDDEVVVEKLISLDSTYAITVDRSNARSQSFSGNIDALEDKALKVQVRRDVSDLSVISRNISEGTLEIYNDTGKVSLSFSDVLFPVGSCQPTSGQVLGKIESATDSSNNLEFTVTYSDSEANIVFSNGDESTLSLVGCDFEAAATTEDSQEPILEEQAAE